MKKIALILLALLCMLGTVACAEESNAPDNMHDVAAKNAAFHLYVPLSWTASTDGGASGAVSPMGDGANVTVIPKMIENENEDTPEEYWQNVCLPAYQKAGSPLAEFNLVTDKCGDTSLGEKSAKRYVFTYRMDEQYFEVMQIITVAGDHLYTLTFTAKNDRYDSYADQVEQIRAAFVFR